MPIQAVRSHLRFLPLSMALLASAPFFIQPASAQTAPTAVPANAAPYMLKSWISALTAPWPAGKVPGAVGSQIPQSEYDLNGYGLLGSYQPGGATPVSNAFFASLGTNGRSCVTCHQPASSMSISGSAIVGRYISTGGKDPLFAPVDGANCPSAVPAAYTSKSYLGGLLGGGRDMAAAHSLILTRGVFRIFLPMPANAEFTLKVISDAPGCNTDNTYGHVTDATGATTQMISVYRRPLLATNLKYVTLSVADLPGGGFGPPGGATAPDDPSTGLPESGNIMWDGREPTLQSQAIDATLGHAQATQAPTDDQVKQMVEFENGFYSAQQSDWFAGNLAVNGVLGGPIALSTNTGIAGGGGPGGPGGAPPAPTFDLFDAWSGVTGSSLSQLQQASIYRGQQIFNTRTFSLANVPGFGFGGGGPPGGGGGPPAGTCSLCHSQHNAGSDQIPNAQHAIGVGGDAPTFGGPQPAKDLPVFELTCLNGALSPYNTTVIQTNDPGKALITGKCADIAQFTTPPLRGLASHAPYFHDGSAATLLAVVNFYAARFNTGYTAQDKIDLVNFLSSL